MSAIDAAILITEYQTIEREERGAIWEVGNADTFVYFMHAGQFVKIGLSNDVKRRRQQIQGSNPEKVKLLLAMRGNTYYEEAWHAVFHEYHVRGEWFEFGPRIKRAIDKGLDYIKHMHARGEYLDYDERGLPL